jgi:hypothetical protein
MKKQILFSIFITFIYNFATGQSTGFKIKNTKTYFVNKDSTININWKGSSEKVYKTLGIIRFNYNDQDIDERDSLKTLLLNELYNNSTSSPKIRFSEAIIKQKEDSIKQLTSFMDSLGKIQDSLYYNYVKDYIQINNFNFLNFGPQRSKALFEYIYGGSNKKFKTLTNTGFNIGNNTGSVFSELVNGNLGLFRVSLGTMISKNSNSDSAKSRNEEAYQRLVTYGGNTVLCFEYPLAYFHSSNNKFNLISRGIAKGTADFPVFGTTTDKWAGSASFGFDIYADASLDNNAIRFFANFNLNNIYGTDTFRDNLGLKSNNFSFGQLSVGLVFLENIKLSFVISTFSNQESLRNRNVVAGGQVIN